MPYEQILEKIRSSAAISEDELQQRIQEKMDQLAGLISKEGAAHIIANELGIKLLEQQTGRLKIKNTLPGMRNVEVVAKVQERYEVREFQKDDRVGKVGSCLIEDDTQKIRLVFWGNMTDQLLRLEKGDIIKVQGGYVKDNNGRREIHLNEKSTITVNPTGEDVDIKEQMITRKSVSSLKEQDDNVELFGTIVQLYDIHFFELCPRCQKRVKQRIVNHHQNEQGETISEAIFACDYHGDITPQYSCVMNCYLDDGTGNVRLVFFQQQIQQLLQKTGAELMEYRQEQKKFEEAKQDLLGRIIKASGRANKNIMFDRMEFIVAHADRNPDPKKEIERLQHERKQLSVGEKTLEELQQDNSGLLSRNIVLTSNGRTQVNTENAPLNAIEEHLTRDNDENSDSKEEI